MKNRVIIFLIIFSLKVLAQNSYVYKEKKIDHVLPKLTLKITRVYQGDNHGKITIDFVHNAKDDSLNKKKFGRIDFYDYLDLVISENNGLVYHLDRFELENVLYQRQPLRFSADTIQLTFKHVSSGLGYYEYYYEPIIFCSRKDVFFLNNYELKQDNNWREVGRVYKKPFVFEDYVDQAPLYHLNKYYVNTETGKIYKGSKLLRKFKAKTLFQEQSKFILINENLIYYSKDGKQKMKGKDLIQSKKVDINLWEIKS
ncbi:MAG: hypothetical protein JNJ40_18455 [Bacteroidia bacterium]|nr:hypothetical protein [Bacteroidia bacterium]